jgi:hypothetical protein
MSAKISSFFLTKWYLDCLKPDGDGAIVYVAELRWKTLRMRYASTLTMAGGTVEVKASIRSCTLPEAEAGKIVLQLPHLGVEGVWEGLATPMEQEVFACEKGAIHWNCLQPASRVAMTLGGRKAAGLGYAEVLRITLPPWKLPLDELHWGHFVSECDSVVWIDWRGPFRYRVLLHNGKQLEVVSITEQEVRSPDICLSLDRGLVLRHGELGKTVFPSIRKLVQYVPVSMLHVAECKWRSRAVLRQADRATSGWAIHEVVRWQGK